MHTLCLTQTALGEDRYAAMLSLDNGAPVSTQFSFSLDAQAREDLRWYLEDYLQNPLDPAPLLARRVEEKMIEVGARLFREVFESSEPARRMWARMTDMLSETRIEIITGIREATAIPWELLRDPLTDVPLALRAQSFVRAPVDSAQPALAPQSAHSDKLRVLLVICRPAGREDVPFRSVASRIVRTLTQEARDLVQLDVLRPPTFEQLSKTVREAKRAGAPYHMVHFDGHGVYEELIPAQESQDDKTYPARLAELLKRLNVITLGTPRAGKHGYVLFENPKSASNMTLVDGAALGNLMVETAIPTLVLNACQSAYADAPALPAAVGEGSAAAALPDSTQDQVRAFGSFAQEVMYTGVAGVVAMRYVLYVETAKKFVADLYAGLVRGDSLGEAVTFGRKQLASDMTREVAYRAIELQDWQVPVVYEARPLQMLPRGIRGGMTPPLHITLGASQATLEGVPPPPDVGFLGRDETLLALDRAFDTEHVVLLHAYAGSGKTTTMAEFARWYVETGGLRGAVLFTKFEQHKPLVRVLDDFGAAFGSALERSGVNWLALDDGPRRAVALQVMQQVPVLWLWDNVEPIAGFPAGTPSAWSGAEQQELRAFLAEARATQAKFLLTSRRDEADWLGNLPRRITLPPMPMQERWELARALASRQSRRLDDVQDWRPLLEFTRGNPMTVTVLVGQALRDGLETRDEILRFVAKLRAGETAFTDDASQGRDKSLGASLAYGFDTAFNENERKILALLNFFQGFVDVDALIQMGRLKTPTGEDYSLPEVRGLTREQGITLLDRAAEIGLLTAHGGGYYSIHPALPWYFNTLFEQSYRHESTGDSQAPAPRSPAARSFAEAMGALGDYYHDQYEHGNRDVIGMLEAEEANLLHARMLARRNGWWSAVISTMQGLRQLYDHTGRRAGWARLVNDIVPDLVDPATDGPLEGRQEQWGLVNDYRVRLAQEARRWTQAERLQRVRVEWDRQRAAPALALAPEQLDDTNKNRIRTLAVSVEELGHILREQGKAECIAHYQQAVAFYQRIGDRPAQAVACFNLGHAYLDIPALRDLAQAERWYQHSLELYDGRDRLGRGGCLSQLGLVAYERFKDAVKAHAPEPELLRHLNDALRYYNQALELLPPNAVDALAVAHNMLGIIYKNAGDIDRALPHYNESIRYEELQGNLYGAAQSRFNVAVALAQAGRFADALDYARAALRNLETFGEAAADLIERTKGLIGRIEELQKK